MIGIATRADEIETRDKMPNLARRMARRNKALHHNGTVMAEADRFPMINAIGVLR
jgi:hypothetical protein